MEKSFAGRCPSGQLLTAYVEGSLSIQQQLRVEDHLLDCPLCESAVAAFTEHGLPTPEPTVIPLTKLKPLPQPRRSSYWPSLAAAAAVIFMLFAGWQYWAATENERLFDAYFDPQPIYGYEQQRVVNQQTVSLETSLREQAFAYHLGGKYPEALMSWRAYFDAGTATDSWLPLLYAANAALATGKVEEAAFFLEQLPPDLAGAQGEQLQWYRIMLDLKLNHLDLAKERLEAMTKVGTTPYGKKMAVELLDRMD